MNDLNNYTRTCKDTIGHTKRVYISKFVDYDESQIFLTDGVVTTIPSLTVYKYDVEGSYTQSSESQAGAISWNQNVNINLNKVYNVIDPVIYVNQKYRIIVETNNGEYLIFGLFNGMDCSLNNASGDSKDTFNGFSLSFTGQEEEAANLTELTDYTLYVAPPATATYGRLYNWPTINEATFMPTDWEPASETDYDTLATYLLSTNVGGKLKETGLTYWDTPNTGATNETKWNGRGGGNRSQTTGAFSLLNSRGYFWTKTEVDADTAKVKILANDDGDLSVLTQNKNKGYSVRGIYKGAGVPPTQITDYDGRVYEVVQIGTQYWTRQNWASAYFENGVAIPNPQTNGDWIGLTADLDLNYGRLYNWYALSGLAPSSMRVPTLADWNALIAAVTDSGDLKETGLTHWNTPNTGADNLSGFTGLGSGERTSFGGAFGSLKDYGYYWVSSSGWFLLDFESVDFSVTESLTVKASGWSVRMVSDVDPGATVTDYEGRIYDVVQIGSQYWTVQNWSCSTLNDGTPIPTETDNTAWAALTTLAQCVYNNDTLQDRKGQCAYDNTDTYIPV